MVSQTYHAITSTIETLILPLHMSLRSRCADDLASATCPSRRDHVRQMSIMAEHLTSLGRRTACMNARFICCSSCGICSILAGETDNDSFSAPLTQELLADTLGLSIIHTNRTLQRLLARTELFT